MSNTSFFLLFSIGGVVLVSLSDRAIEPEIPVGALWALGGALLYAMYLVLLRRRVDNEDKLNIPMFFGKSWILYVQPNPKESFR